MHRKKGALKPQNCSWGSSSIFYRQYTVYFIILKSIEKNGAAEPQGLRRNYFEIITYGAAEPSGLRRNYFEIIT
ncbi:MAG: hypothetical protein V3U20_05695 [Thermoplasmata archaeon]